MTVIDRSAATPLYYQLREEMRGRILAGEWSDGEPLPPEMSLCEAHAVSRSVVRQAIGDLVHEGLLERRRGLGTFVTKPKIAESLAAQEVGFYEDMTSKGHDVRTRVLHQAIEEASSEDLTDLELSPGDLVLVLRRVRSVDDVPLVYVESRLSAERFPDLINQDFSSCSLYGVLESRYSVKVAGSSRLIGATIATPNLASLLNTKVKAPLVVLESISYDQDNTPVEKYLAYHRGDRLKLEVQTKADGAALSKMHVIREE